MNSPLFDLHVHTSLKHFLTRRPSGKRRSLHKPIVHWSNPLARALPIIQGQSGLRQLRKGGVRAAVISISPLERAVAREVQKVRVIGWFTAVRNRFLGRIARAEYSYFDLLQEEVRYVGRELSSLGNPPRSSFGEFLDDQPNYVLSIEGGHALLGAGDAPETILPNLRHLLDGPHRFLYLTLNHLTHSPLANHCYARKRTDGSRLSQTEFLPQQMGLQQLGKEVIRTAYSARPGRPLFIDLKHLSLRARLDFYEMRRREGWSHIPLMATHCAATGFAWQDLPDHIDYATSCQHGDHMRLAYRPTGPEGNLRRFNPWSLNLYDEEVGEIVRSGGLIGLCLDVRVLGGRRLRPEIFYGPELATLFPHLVNRVPVARFDTKKPPVRAMPSPSNPLDLLADQILHLVRAGGAATWRHLCIGSDYDGLIQPIRGFPTARRYPQFGARLKQAIGEAARRNPYFSDSIADLDHKIRGILYNNAYEFMRRHFS